MSQVDDWSDGYTSDYLRDLNTYGPASANVPRSSVVSHQVRYRAPDTSDIPLAPGQNPEDSVYSNASGARMGQTKPASGYRAPAGGGWDVNSSDTSLRFSNESGGKQYRVSRTQTAKKTAKKTVKKQSQAEYHTGGALTRDESNVAERAASHRQSDFDWGELNGQALDAAARFLPALRLLSGFGVGAGAEQSSTDIPETNFNRGLMGGVGRQAEAIRKPAPESSSVEDQFKNMPWYEDAKAHHEAVKKNMDDYGSALGTLKSTWDDIPWWTKLVMLPPVFKAGSPAAGASTTGNVWAEGSRAAAGDATAGAKAFEESLSRMNGGAVRGAPTESFAQPAASASAGWRTGRTAEYPAGTGKLDQFGGWGESGRSAVGTGSAPASDGAAKLGEQTVSYKDSVARLADAGDAGRGAAAAGGQAAGWTSSLAQQLRAAGIPEDQIAASIARINAGAAGREAAAAGREAAAAGREAVAAGEQAAAERAGINAEIARANMEASDVFNAQLIQRIKAGTTTPDDRKVIWALMQARITPYTPASDRAVVDAARAAGIIK